MTAHVPVPKHPIQFIDLAAQRRRLGDRIDQAILAVVNHGKYILGPEVASLERALSEFCGAKSVVTCANGTDALSLVLMAKNVGPGDAVICPSFTFAATAEVVALVGGTPVFVDVLPNTFNVDPASVRLGVERARQLNLRPVGIIPVDLFGQPADFDSLSAIAREHGLWVLADAAQSFGATYQKRKVGALGDATTTSFFPAKPLGCYGDGGAIFTDDPELADVLRSLRVHGQGSDKYDNVRIGLNGRLDTIQAAVLLEKLKVFPDEIERREAVARRYNEALSKVSIVPTLAAGTTSVWAQYTLRVGSAQRQPLADRLKAEGIPTAIYYPRPLHQQTAYRHYPVAGNGLPVSEAIAKEVISLPMHPYLEAEVQDIIINAVERALA